MRTIDIIAGARPNFMKIAPIIRAIVSKQQQGLEIKFRLIHTGQHYDKKMSGDFFRQLEIPDPDHNLGAGSGTQSEQTAAIMINYESVLIEKPCDLCLVVGDVTSTMACAITARKLNIRVAHVEAGIRSRDWTMPEEINRVVTDSISNYYFTTSESAGKNLLNAGADESSIYFVGNTMIDTLLYNLNNLQAPHFWDKLNLREGNYLVLTLHRPSNVDDPERLHSMLKEISACCQGFPIIFPVHPRTEKSIRALQRIPEFINIVDPQPYREFIHLIRYAKAVITDSGGITEETTVLGIPCMTLRDNTERPETVDIGTNELLGNAISSISPALKRLFEGGWKKGSIPEKWDGFAGTRIADHLSKVV